MPAMTATIVPASSACCMNGYRKSSWKSVTKLTLKAMLLVPVVLFNAHYRNVAPRVMQNLDNDSVKICKRFCCQKFCRLHSCNLVIRYKGDFVTNWYELIDVVRYDK